MVSERGRLCPLRARVDPHRPRARYQFVHVATNGEWAHLPSDFTNPAELSHTYNRTAGVPLGVSAGGAGCTHRVQSPVLEVPRAHTAPPSRD